MSNQNESNLSAKNKYIRVKFRLLVQGNVWTVGCLEQTVCPQFSPLPSGSMFFYFLWAVIFMKLYSVEVTLCTNVGGPAGVVDPKTF